MFSIEALYSFEQESAKYSPVVWKSSQYAECLNMQDIYQIIVIQKMLSNVVR